MNKHDEQTWSTLRDRRMSPAQKDRIRRRIMAAADRQPTARKSFRYPSKSIAAACLLFLIFGGFLLLSLLDLDERPASPSVTTESLDLSWNYSSVYMKNTEKGIFLYRKGSDKPVGTLKKADNNTPPQDRIHMDEELEGFPYPTHLFIEHVKQMDTVIRYHFLIKRPGSEQEGVYMTFDYPKLEHAEIFRIISTLRIEGEEPADIGDMLLVRHGYSKLLYPSDLTPVSVSVNEEIYEWDSASANNFAKYLDRIQADSFYWIPAGPGTYTSIDKLETVTIALKDGQLHYNFEYHEQ